MHAREQRVVGLNLVVMYGELASFQPRSLLLLPNFEKLVLGCIEADVVCK